jgi:hypothetical protein
MLLLGLTVLVAWLDKCNSTIIYESLHCLAIASYVYHTTTSILGRLGLVPVGKTDTIPFSMRQETRDFPGASCVLKKGAGDYNRWWYINSWALKWVTSQ